jgi:tetratricopeptide repeat protein 21B
MLARFTHAHPEAQLLGARALFLNGALDAASRKAADILRFNGDNIQAVLLVVGVHVRQGRPAEAMAALEAAVSANFSIRDAPLYHVTHSQVLVANGRLEDAKKVRVLLQAHRWCSSSNVLGFAITATTVRRPRSNNC